METHISTQHILEKSSISPLTLSETGPMLEKSDLLDPMGLGEDTTLMTSKNSSVLKIKQKKKQSVMQESVHSTKKKILKDNANSLEKDIQARGSLKTSGAVLTGKDKGCYPFWKKLTKEISEQLWSPIKTVCVDLATSCWNGFSIKPMSNSWFSVKTMTIEKTLQENYQTTFLQSQLYSLPDTTREKQSILETKEEKKKKNNEKKKKNIKKKIDKETEEEKEARIKKEIEKQEKILKRQQNKEKARKKAEDNGEEFFDPALKAKAGKTIKYRVYLDKEARKIDRNMRAVTRVLYNKCLTEYLKVQEENKLKEEKDRVTVTLKYLREKCINDDVYKSEDTWMLDYLYDFRDSALQDFWNNLKSNLAKEKYFKLKFRTRADQNNKNTSLIILAKHWNKPPKFFREYYNSILKSNKEIPKIIRYTSRLIKTATGKYFISIPQPLNPEYIERTTPRRTIYFDPGIRCFLTGYDPSGMAIFIGQNDIGRIARLLHYTRKLQSKQSLKTIKSKKRKNLKKAEMRLREKIENLVDDLHRKTAKWLCENYDQVYIPRLNFHNLKNLHSKEKAKLACLRHCNFLERLTWKSREYPCKIFEAREEYTSKTCSSCGSLKNIGKSREYNCDNCGCIFDRDVNAAKNICLKFATENLSPAPEGVEAYLL